jgi:hypothetical protein
MGNITEICQATGVVAAFCTKNAILPRKLDVSMLQARLCEMSVKLQKERNDSFGETRYQYMEQKITY